MTHHLAANKIDQLHLVGWVTLLNPEKEHENYMCSINNHSEMASYQALTVSSKN